MTTSVQHQTTGKIWTIYPSTTMWTTDSESYLSSSSPYSSSTQSDTYFSSLVSSQEARHFSWYGHFSSPTTVFPSHLWSYYTPGDSDCLVNSAHALTADHYVTKTLLQMNRETSSSSEEAECYSVSSSSGGSSSFSTFSCGPLLPPPLESIETEEPDLLLTVNIFQMIYLKIIESSSHSCLK